MEISEWAPEIEFKAEKGCIKVCVDGKTLNGVMEIGFDNKNGIPIVNLSMLGINAYMYREDGTKVTLKEMIEKSNESNESKEQNGITESN